MRHDPRTRPARPLSLAGRGIAATLAAGACACVASATDPDPKSDASPPPRVADAATRADAEPPADAGSADASFDAEPACAVPLTFDLDSDGLAYLLYEHPDCSGGSGFELDATLVFEDTIDQDDTFAAYPLVDSWVVQEIDYPGLDCIVDSNNSDEQPRLLCSGPEAGELIPVRLQSDVAQLDVEFRLDHDGQQVTVETAEHTEL